MKNKNFKVIGLTILLVTFLLGLYQYFYKRPPHIVGCREESIDLTVLDEVTCTASITELDRYALNVKYSLDTSKSGDVRRVRKIIKGNPPLKIRAFIRSLENGSSHELLNKISYPEEYSHAFDALYAEIVRIELRPGRYEFKVKNLSSIPAMKDVTSHIVLEKAYEGK